MPSASPRKSVPLNTGLTPDGQRHLSWLTSFAYSTQSQLHGLVDARPLTAKQAQQLYSPEALRPHLLAGGSAALNITGMLGQAAESQLSATQITAGPIANLPTNLTGSNVGQVYVATDVGHIFVWGGSSWAMVDGAGYGVFATTSPVPSAFWASVAVGGGTVNVTNANGLGTSAVVFGPYTTIGAGYLLYVRI